MEYFRLCVKWFCILNTWLLSAGSHCKIIKSEPHNLLFLIGITLLVALAVYVFRFIWVYVLYPLFYLSVSPFQKLMNDDGTNTKEKPLNEVCMR